MKYFKSMQSLLLNSNMSAFEQSATSPSEAYQNHAVNVLKHSTSMQSQPHASKPFFSVTSPDYST